MPIDIAAIRDAAKPKGMRSPAEIMAAVDRGELSPTPAIGAGRASREALDQSEIVSLQELHKLADKLSRRENPQHSLLGRSLEKALSGAAFVAKGSRNSLTYKLAGEIIEAHPFAELESVAQHFSAALSLQGEPSIKTFIRQLETHQSKKQGKAETLRTVGETVTLPEHAGDPPVDVPGAPPAGSPEARGTKDVVVLADGVYYVRHPMGETYELVMKSAESFRLEMRNQFGDTNATLNLIDPMGKMLPNETILGHYGSNATGGTIKDFAVPSTRFDPARAVLKIGHRMAPASDAAPSQAVEAWLRELAGGTDEDLLALYDWVAATDQRYIGLPAVALAVVAPKDSGKSLLAKALAMTWASIAPVPLKNAVQQFNGALQLCPIWHADEEIPEDLTGHVFRDFVASRERLIEPKGKEKIPLLGCPRILITVNELADLKIEGANGPDAVAAIGDRITLFNPTEKTATALRGLQLPGTWDVDLAAIVRHLRFVQANMVPREQRFLGGRSGAANVRLISVRGAQEKCPEVFEAIGNYLQDPDAAESQYREACGEWGEKGCVFPIVMQDRAVWVCAAELADKLRLPGGLARVTAAIKTILPEAPADRVSKQIEFGKARRRYYQIRHQDVAEVLGFDDGTLAEITRALEIGTRARLRVGKPV